MTTQQEIIFRRATPARIAHYTGDSRRRALERIADEWNCDDLSADVSMTADVLGDLVAEVAAVVLKLAAGIPIVEDP